MLDVRVDSKRYPCDGDAARTILRDVVFRIEPGEITGLLGSSGAGKSTLLRILLGLDTAFEGRVTQNFHRVGVVFQEPRLLPWLTVEQNIRLVVTGTMKQPDVPALLEAVQLGHTAGLRPAQLSLGMARRVSLARAMAIEPDLLVLDEPFASLDARLGGTLAASVARWARGTGSAVIVATHDLAQALDHVTRLLVLTGTPASLQADIAVPPCGDPGLHGRLTRQFPFLRSGAEPEHEHEQLPPGKTPARP